MAKSYACVFNFFPYHKRLEIHPMGNAKFASKNFYKSFHLYRRLRTKGDLKKTYRPKLLKKELICKGVFCRKIRQPKGKTFHSRKKCKLLQKAWDFKDFVVQKGEKYYANVKVYSLHKMAL